MPKSPERNSQSATMPTTEVSATASQNDKRLFDNVLAEGDSYEALKKASSGGAHFQFNFEKSWTLTDPPVNSKFQVKISSMSQNFSSIPFGDRWNLYAESYFRQNDVPAPEDCSQSDDCVFLETCENASLKPTRKDDREISTFSTELDQFDEEWAELSQSPVIASTSFTAASTEKSNDDMGVSKLSKLNINQETSGQKSESAESKNSLEDWLDTILDD